MDLLDGPLRTPDFTFNIGGIKDLLERETFHVQSPVFPWRDYPGLARVNLEVGQDDLAAVSMDLRLQEDFRFRAFPSVLYVLKDLTSSGPKKHIVRKEDHLFGDNDAFQVDLVHKTRLRDSVYNADDSISVEAPLYAEEVHSYDGSVEVPLPGVSEEKGPYFYAGPMGYRVRVKWYLHEGKGLSVEVRFDGPLPLNFAHRATLVVYNRKCLWISFKKTVERDVAPGASYVMALCDKKELERLIENDSFSYAFYIQLLTDPIH